MDERPARGGPPREQADPDPRGGSAREPDARATDRTTDSDAREASAEADEARFAERADQVDQILAAADERDERADLRDEEADAREQAASLDSFLHDPEYDATLKARRAAAIDRSYSKTDRAAGASDRANLSDRPEKAPDQKSEG